jgi:tRNA-dihydrouridine synthase
VAERGADLIDLNMGCPVPKVCKTGAGAALIKDPDTAVAVARAAREGSGLPVTVKLRSGQRPGETDGYELAHRLVTTRASARSASTRAAPPSTTRAPRLRPRRAPRRTLDAPVILTGGLSTARAVRSAHERTGARRSCSRAARWATRGCSSRSRAGARRRRRRRVLAELDWVMDAAVEHLGADRAGRYSAQVLPLVSGAFETPEGSAAGMQATATLADAGAVLAGLDAARGCGVATALYCAARPARSPPAIPL